MNKSASYFLIVLLVITSICSFLIGKSMSDNDKYVQWMSGSHFGAIYTIKKGLLPSSKTRELYYMYRDLIDVDHEEDMDSLVQHLYDLDRQYNR